jgi:hypothetical protein
MQELNTSSGAIFTVRQSARKFQENPKRVMATASIAHIIEHPHPLFSFFASFGADGIGFFAGAAAGAAGSTAAGSGSTLGGTAGDGLATTAAGVAVASEI